jgi:hypothetical protein
LADARYLLPKACCPITYTSNPTKRQALVTQMKAIRWYNPKLEDFEWREEPKSDEEALALLSHHASCERYVEVYEEWRTLGAPIVVALVRAGEAAQSEGVEKRAERA